MFGDVFFIFFVFVILLVLIWIYVWKFFMGVMKECEEYIGFEIDVVEESCV